jgi:hypothetical protein
VNITKTVSCQTGPKRMLSGWGRDSWAPKDQDGLSARLERSWGVRVHGTDVNQVRLVSY